MMQFTEWDDSGRSTPVTARLLAGMYAVEYKKRYHMMPMSPVQDDIESFDAMLSILHENPNIAPYCLQVLFGNRDFNVNANAFCNPNILDKWNVVEKASKLLRKNGTGEQSEFRSTQRKHYGVVRV
jgi:hypothetical protein